MSGPSARRPLEDVRSRSASESRNSEQIVHSRSGRSRASSVVQSNASIGNQSSRGRGKVSRASLVDEAEGRYTPYDQVKSNSRASSRKRSDARDRSNQYYDAGGCGNNRMDRQAVLDLQREQSLAITQDNTPASMDFDDMDREAGIATIYAGDGSIASYAASNRTESVRSEPAYRKVREDRRTQDEGASIYMQQNQTYNEVDRESLCRVRTSKTR